MIARKIVVEGIVQGVGFRWATRDEAVRLGIAGWVRNRSDGSVEAHVEGPPNVVEAMLDWLSRGPIGSVVASVSVEAVDPGGLEGFRVVR
jgi:acylphosphatase